MSQKTEVDKLLDSINLMYTKLKGEEEKNRFNDVKDKFDRFKFKISQKMQEIENNLNESDKLKSSDDPKDIIKRKKHENNASNALNEIEKDLNNLKIELKAQEKKTNKYSNVENKKEIYRLLNQRYNLLKGKLDGVPEVEGEIEDNRTNLEKFDELLQKKNNENYQERELYDEEINKMEEWKKEVNKQNKDLDEIHDGVKDLKGEIKTAGEGIKAVGEKVKKTTKKTDEIQKKIETQNMKLKKLLKKIRSGDKICVDLILFFIIIGLVCVLYSIIKHKF
jgi:structural maintenance of chromosome 2